jgi:hypothetical protein
VTPETNLSMGETIRPVAFYVSSRNWPLKHKVSPSYSLRPRKSVVLGFSDIVFDRSSYSKNFNKYYLFYYDLFYH